jgi:hypothetical protein
MLNVMASIKTIILTREKGACKDGPSVAVLNVAESVKTILFNKDERYKQQAKCCTAECHDINKSNHIKQRRTIHAKVGRVSLC